MYRTLHQVTLDHSVTASDRLQVKWRRWRPNREATTQTFGISSNWNHFRGQYSQKEDALTINHTRTLSDRVVNEASFGFRRSPEAAPVESMPSPISRIQREPNGFGALGQLFKTPTLKQWDPMPQIAAFGGPPDQAPNISWDARFPIHAVDLRWSVQNNLMWTTGRHLVKTGIYYEFNINSEGFSANCFSGFLDFTATGTTAAQNPFNTNHPRVNALLDQYTTYSESNVPPFCGSNQWKLEWFVHDSWKARSALTLELGPCFPAGVPWHLRKEGWKRYAPPAGERAAGWLAEAYDLSRNPLQPACPGGAATCAANQRLARDPRTGVILADSNAMIGLTDYDSLQVTANRRLMNGVAFGTANTLAKTMSLEGALMVLRDPRLDYSESGRRHVLSVNASWQLPDGSSLWNTTATRFLLDGWQLAGVGFVRSGRATVNYSTTDAGGTDTMGGRGNADVSRITLVPGCNPKLSRSERSEDRWFNTSCFARTSREDSGSPLQNVQIRQPVAKNLDLTLSKNFPIGGGAEAISSSGAEVYNALGLSERTAVTSAQFDLAGNQVNSEFGRLQLPADEARVIELPLRFQF